MLEFPCDVEYLENGNILISDAGDEVGLGSEIIEVDPIGNIVWRYAEGLAFAHSAKRHPDGSTLISDTRHNRVIEVSAEGKLLFSTADLPRLSDGSTLNYPNNAEYLEDGSFLVTDRNNNRCIIINRKGRVLWEYSRDIFHPHNAHVLKNGNVIIANSDGNRIIEVNPKGDLVYSYGGAGEKALNWPRDGFRLENGNTLITSSRDSAFYEVSPGGEIVFEKKLDYFANLYNTRATPRGTYLSSDQQRHQILEFDAYGNIIWQFRNYRNVNKIFPALSNGSFSKRNSKGPADWTVFKRFGEGGGELIWDETVKPKAAPGLRFDRDGAVYLMQIIDVTPGFSYEMSGSVKTECLDGGFVFLQLAFLDHYGALVQDASKAPKSEFITCSRDYHKQSLTALAPAAAAMAEVRICISGPGRFYVKNVTCAQI
jgi:outer membrane protein assembly factor BamB